MYLEPLSDLVKIIRIESVFFNTYTPGRILRLACIFISLLRLFLFYYYHNCERLAICNENNIGIFSTVAFMFLNEHKKFAHSVSVSISPRFNNNALIVFIGYTIQTHPHTHTRHTKRHEPEEAKMLNRNRMRNYISVFEINANLRFVLILPILLLFVLYHNQNDTGI